MIGEKLLLLFATLVVGKGDDDLAERLAPYVKREVIWKHRCCATADGMSAQFLHVIFECAVGCKRNKKILMSNKFGHSALAKIIGKAKGKSCLNQRCSPSLFLQGAECLFRPTLGMPRSKLYAFMLTFQPRISSTKPFGLPGKSFFVRM